MKTPTPEVNAERIDTLEKAVAQLNMLMAHQQARLDAALAEFRATVGHPLLKKSS